MSNTEKSLELTPGVDERQQYLTKFSENDRENPHSFSSRYKAWLAFQMGLMCLAATLGSSIIAPAGPAIAETYNISQEVSVLSISLFMLG